MAHPSEHKGRAGRALVTGLGGFTGRYVAAELESAGYEVIGLAQDGYASGESTNMVDLCDRDAVLSAVDGLAPDVVVHLAAISFVAHGDADAIYRVNIVGTRNLLEALAHASKSPRIVVLASSANIYGNATVEPITEDTPPAPANDYAVSKLAMEAMARLWQNRLPIAITRPFNYTGAGQAHQFLLPKIVQHYARGAPEIELGNIDVVRDFMDVRDIARCYRDIVEVAPAGETFNLCSGRGYSLREILDIVGDLAGYRIDVRVNPAFVRENEVRRLVGSRTRLVERIADVTPRPLEQTLSWMLGAARADLQSGDAGTAVS